MVLKIAMDATKQQARDLNKKTHFGVSSDIFLVIRYFNFGSRLLLPGHDGRAAYRGSSTSRNHGLRR